MSRCIRKDHCLSFEILQMGVTEEQMLTYMGAFNGLHPVAAAKLLEVGI